MKHIKKLMKLFIPGFIFRALLPLFHLWQSVLYNIIFIFPARRLKVIAVTGTNGKTTTVSYIASILEAEGHKVGVTSTSYYKIGKKIIHNNENRTVADPIKVFWMLRRMRWARCDWVVMETTSHALEQDRLWGIPIEAAVMTNLTQDHMDYHKTMDNYAAAKAKLFAKNPNFIALNADDEWYEYYDEHAATIQKMSYGSGADSQARISNARLSPHSSSFKMTLDHTVELDFKTKLIGKFNIYNAAAAITITYLLYVDKNSIIKGIKDMPTVPGRMDVVEADVPYNLLIDFAHTPDGLEKVLETLKNLTKERVILVFGGTGNRDLERQKMGEIAGRLADRIVLTDDEPYDKDPAELRADVLVGIKKAKGASKTNEVATGRRDGIKKALEIARTGDTVVITGMGDYDFMKIGSEYVPWNDRQATEEILLEMGRLKPADVQPVTE